MDRIEETVMVVMDKCGMERDAAIEFIHSMATKGAEEFESMTKKEQDMINIYMTLKAVKQVGLSDMVSQDKDETIN